MVKKSVSFEPLPYIYPNSTGLKIEDIKIPKNLQKYINELEKVSRYNDGIHQEKGMIPDNSKAHTIRCIYYAKTMLPNGNVERMLWVHDIPELGLESDVNAVGRFHNPQAASQIEKEEGRLAEKLLSKKTLSYINSFKQLKIFSREQAKNPQKCKRY